MSDYSLSAQALHYMALEVPLLGEIAFDLERNLFLKSAPEPSTGAHVFVSGLARAGTTILMRELYNSGQFASLTYVDMPFVLCPNAWHLLSRRFSKEQAARERAHGDGILVDFNSPEALDEVFWRVFTRSDYIKEDGLHPYSPDTETLSAFGDYTRLVMRCRQKTRYLSKNNNNILRIPALRARFPDAVFLVPIREPVSQAQSLLSQHERFLQGDRFTQKYMTWLGHHEFGATHRPFVLGTRRGRFDDPSSLEYWLEQWIRCYSHLEAVFREREDQIYFVPYESLCGMPAVWQRVADVIGVDADAATPFKLSQVPLAWLSDSELLQTAQRLYSRIRQEALEKLGVRQSPAVKRRAA